MLRYLYVIGGVTLLILGAYLIFAPNETPTDTPTQADYHRIFPEPQEIKRLYPTPTPTPTPVPTPTPTPTLTETFLAGYRAGGGDPQYEEHWVNDVIPCESEWNTNPSGHHYGLAQFAPETWESAKCSPSADYTNPYDQGCAVANWLLQIAPNWGTTAGWPVCWWR